jgi:protein SSD1
LVEEDDQKKKKDVDLDSLQDMIETLKNLPPISNNNNVQQAAPVGNRKQASMSALGGTVVKNHHQVTTNKRLSHNSSNGGSEILLPSSDTRHHHRSRRSQSVSSSSNPILDTNMFTTLSRGEALAEAEAKLMGTFSQQAKKGSNRHNSGQGPPPASSSSSSRRYSESQKFDASGITTSTSSSKRASLQLPTLNENMVASSTSTGRRIHFNKPLNLSSSNKSVDTDGDNKRLSGGHQRRSSRNLDMDWRASSSISNTASNNSNRNSFHLVPFTPTRVNFARDDANPHQRRPLFIAHLPFSALPPLFRERQLNRGALRVNKRNRSDAYVFCEDLDDDIYICGSRDRNRALEGDVVAVRLVDVDKVLREKKEKEEAKLARNGGQAKVRLPDEEDENEIIFGGDENVNIVKPKFCGVVVAILERAQNQVFSG